MKRIVLVLLLLFSVSGISGAGTVNTGLWKKLTDSTAVFIRPDINALMIVDNGKSPPDTVIIDPLGILVNIDEFEIGVPVIRFGSNVSPGHAVIEAVTQNAGGQIRFNDSTARWEYSDNGSVFVPFNTVPSSTDSSWVSINVDTIFSNTGGTIAIPNDTIQIGDSLYLVQDADSANYYKWLWGINRVLMEGWLYDGATMTRLPEGLNAFDSVQFLSYFQIGMDTTLRVDSVLVDSIVKATGRFSATGGSGTNDSMGVDTDGNGTVDNYLYSTTAGAFHLKKGANITLSVLEDTLTIAGPAASGTADSVGVDTNGDGVIDGYAYSTAGAAFVLKEGTGATLTLTADTVSIATTLGASVDMTSEITGIAPVGNGGTGANTLTDGGILLGSGTGALTALGVATNGQIPIGDGTTDPVLGTVTGGAGLSVTNGAGTISIAHDAHTGDVTGATALTIGNDKILESHLKAINAPTDEYVLTYEATVGDFEWQASAGGGPTFFSFVDSQSIVHVNDSTGDSLLYITESADSTILATQNLYFVIKDRTYFDNSIMVIPFGGTSIVHGALQYNAIGDQLTVGDGAAVDTIPNKDSVRTIVGDSVANYQPLDATLTDIADGTIAENLVNTTNPWADNEVANNLTVDDAGIASTIARDSELDDSLTTESIFLHGHLSKQFFDTTTAQVDPADSIVIKESGLTLSNLGGSVTDAQVPNTITIDNATNATVADSAQNIDTTSATALALTEKIADVAGGAFTGNTETGVTVTYQDADNTVDFSVALGTDIDSTELAATAKSLAEDRAGDTAVVLRTAITDTVNLLRNYQYLDPYWFGGNADGPGDSVELSLGGTNGATAYIVRDSSIDASGDAQTDTIRIMFRMPQWAETLDSVYIVIQGKSASADTSEVTSVVVYAPDKSSASVVADSSYYSDATARNTTTVTKYGYNVNNTQIAAGDPFTVLVTTTLGANVNGVIYFYGIYAVVSD